MSHAKKDLIRPELTRLQSRLVIQAVTSFLKDRTECPEGSWRRALECAVRKIHEARAADMARAEGMQS